MFIKGYSQYIKESFTEDIKSVYSFLKKITKKDKIDSTINEFMSDIKSFCESYDIPLSKIHGKYLPLKKGITLLKENRDKNMAIFLFEIDRYVTLIKYEKGKRINEGSTYFEISDFCIVINIDEQEKGLSDLKKKREEYKKDLPPLKNDDWYRNKNQRNYKKKLKREDLWVVNSDGIDRIIAKLASFYKKSEFPKVVYDLYQYRRINARDFIELLNRLYDYELISDRDFSELLYRCGSRYGHGYGDGYSGGYNRYGYY